MKYEKTERKKQMSLYFNKHDADVGSNVIEKLRKCKRDSMNIEWLAILL